MTNVVHCYFCGRFVSLSGDHYHLYQPPTSIYALEPREPELICCRCSKECKGLGA